LKLTKEASLYLRNFEDFEIGCRVPSDEYTVTADEIVEFARKWDPQPFHVDEKAAEESVFGGLIACSCHVMSISIRLMQSKQLKTNIVAGLGWDEVRLRSPVRPGDKLVQTVECLSKRPSNSKPNTGIIRNSIELVNQNGETVLSYKDNILVHISEGSSAD
jgi:acyl dehydratase